MGSLICRRILVNPTDFWRKSLHSSGPYGVQSKLEVDGMKINFDRVGKGPDPLICLPGALGFIESDFQPLLPKFNPDKFTVITWDPPGYGKSRPPDRDFSGKVNFFHRDAHWANQLMQKLGFEKYSILGWSDGANTGMVMGINYPQSIRNLIMWGGNAYITEADMKLYSQVENIDSWSAKMKAPMIEMYGEDYFRKCWSSWVNLFQEIYEDGGDICKNRIKKLKCPTLILHGMKDAMVPHEHPKYLQENIPKSRLHIMPDGKHNLHIRYADEFVKIVEDFVSEK